MPQIGWLATTKMYSFAVLETQVQLKLSAGPRSLHCLYGRIFPGIFLLLVVSGIAQIIAIFTGSSHVCVCVCVCVCV